MGNAVGVFTPFFMGIQTVQMFAAVVVSVILCLYWSDARDVLAVAEADLDWLALQYHSLEVAESMPVLPPLGRREPRLIDLAGFRFDKGVGFEKFKIALRHLVRFSAAG